MKNTIFIILITLFSSNAIGQTFKPINDKAIVAHYKRMVHRSWGDFQPEPIYKSPLGIKSILGWEVPKVQTSMNASILWGDSYYGVPLGWVVKTTGLIDVDRNRAYRDGEDIRPLRATGLQNRRLAERVIQRKESEKIKAEAEEVEEKAQRDFLHYQGGLIKTEPLWILYYKSKLKDLEKMPDKPMNYKDWGLKNGSIFSRLKSTGEIPILQEKLDLMKNDLKVAKKGNMPRGKRILLLHKCLMDWRNFKRSLEIENTTISTIMEIEKKLKKKGDLSEKIEHKSDLEIINKVLEENKDNF